MPTESAAKLMTVEEWLLYDVPEGLHAELVDGELVMNPLANWDHQQVVRRLTRQVEAFIDASPGVLKTLSAPCRFPIPGTKMPRGREPDLGLYDREPSQPHSALAWQEVRPVVVVEVVSPGDTDRDYVDKRLDYWRAEIPEYWIVDEARRLFLALRRTPHGWDEHLIEDSGTYRTPLLPGLTLAIEPLWG
jgi:Uma2 family endonuclease